MDYNKKTIDVMVKVTGTEKYCVEAETLKEAIEILNNGDFEKYELTEQDLEFNDETFEEI
jgi:hypothetical protein